MTHDTMNNELVLGVLYVSCVRHLSPWVWSLLREILWVSCLRLCVIKSESCKICSDFTYSRMSGPQSPNIDLKSQMVASCRQQLKAATTYNQGSLFILPWLQLVAGLKNGSGNW